MDHRGAFTGAVAPHDHSGSRPANGLQYWAAEGGGGSLTAALFWLVFELAWWWVLAVLMGLLVAFALDWEVGRHLPASLRGRPAIATDEPA